MSKNRSKNRYVYALAFGVPALIFAGVLFGIGGYPFGDRSFAIWDMNLQYLDFFSWLKRVFSGEASLIYSFGKSLGDNTWGLMAYYLSSPFNLLLFFFDDILLFTVVITALKIACCGFTCAIFIKKRFHKISSVWVVLLSSSYALMSYNLVQSSNLMWLDGVILLPLMMLSIYKLVTEERTIFLFISVAIAVLANWYTAYMCCIFSAFYYLYEKILKEKFARRDIRKQYVYPFIRYCMTMILAVGSTMFFFLPTIINLLQGKGIEKHAPKLWAFRCTPLEIVKGILPGEMSGNGSTILVLFCGSLVTIGIVFYFVSRKIKSKEKVLSALLLIFLIFSAVWIPLENVWNGLHISDKRSPFPATAV